MGNTNSSLCKAKDAKQDEFYTRYEDIQNELNHYEAHFKGKTVLCNCDDPFESNFCKFFLRNFNYLKLKRLICTSYKDSPVAGSQISLFDLINGTSAQGHGYVLDVSKVPMANGRGVSDADIDKLLRSKKYVKELKGNGDFRSEECIEYLKQADIVVTNPPFSLFIEYINTLVEYGKQFLILGNQNNVTYKDIFPLLKDNKLWLGYKCGDMAFRVPDYYEPRETRYWVDETGQKWRSFGTICWYTNLDIEKRHEKLVLYKHYTPEEYPTYDNYNAINVDKVADIPMDYAGMMGVPITFMDKFNPDQFEILGLTTGRDEFDPISYPTKRYENAIQHNTNGTTTSGSKANTRATILVDNPKGVYYTADNCDGKLEIVYARILIKRKEQ